MDSKSKVKLNGKFISTHLDWEARVLIPSEAGNFIEAFATADALIDDMVEAVLRQIYHSYESQSLINAIHDLRGSIGFNGLAIAQILKNKTLIDSGLYSKIHSFKRDRNLVVHNIEAEYKLIPPKELGIILNQAELDKKAKDAAKKSLATAFVIFSTLLKVMEDIQGKEKTYLVPSIK